MEKTFEELIKQNCIEIDWTPNIYIPIGRVEALMQQVREATIGECSQIIENILGNTFDEIEEMKTDRIKTEKQ